MMVHNSCVGFQLNNVRFAKKCCDILSGEKNALVLILCHNLLLVPRILQNSPCQFPTAICFTHGFPSSEHVYADYHVDEYVATHMPKHVDMYM